MSLAGSEHLSQIMHIIAQSLLIPCIIILIYFVLVSVIETGALIGEMTRRWKDRNFELTEFLSDLHGSGNIQQKIRNSHLPAHLKKITEDFLDLTATATSGQSIIAQNILGNEEFRLAKICEKTELIAKMGPLLGLMGTLIPLGPGLLGLGKGDFNMLAQYLIVSFDATIIGIFAGGLSFTISKVRRRWYERYLNDLEAILEIIIEEREHAEKTSKKMAVIGGRV